MLRNTTRLLWISFNPRICWSFLYKALLWIHFPGQLALLSCNRIHPSADTTEPEARMWSHVVGLQQWSWGEEIPPRPNYQLPAPNPTPHRCTLPRCQTLFSSSTFLYLLNTMMEEAYSVGRCCQWRGEGSYLNQCFPQNPASRTYWIVSHFGESMHRQVR